MIANIRLAFILAALVLVTVVFATLQWMCRVLKIGRCTKIPHILHKVLLRIIGVRVKVHGKFSQTEPLLLVSNHISWVDILVMGSVRQLSFIAKTEIGTWPVISFLAKLQATVFVNRARRTDTANQADTIGSRLLGGDVMVLFAEGTTGDGNTILPFNSSLLGAAQYAIKHSSLEKVMVQPVAIYYTRLHGIPLGRRYQSEAAWPGDLELLPHLLNFLRKSAFDVDVILGEPLEFTATTSRKSIAKAAQLQVAEMFDDAARARL